MQFNIIIDVRDNATPEEQWRGIQAACESVTRLRVYGEGMRVDQIIRLTPPEPATRLVIYRED